MVEIFWSKNVLDQFEKLEPTIAKRIVRKINEFKEDIFTHDVAKIRGTNRYRLRIGDYRIFFMLEGNVISIVAVYHRNIAYKRI